MILGRCCAWVVLGFSIVCGLLCTFPRHGQKQDSAITTAFADVRNALGDQGVPIMTFNIRLDTEEKDPNNHFTKRVHRLSTFINRTSPWLVGLQEPFSGQLLHLQEGLSKHIKAVGYESNGHGNIDRADPRRSSDFQTGILYDTRHVELIESDHAWLSKTPGMQGSKDWDSGGARTVTIGAFRLKAASSTDGSIVFLNCHLDVWGAEARLQQAKLLLEHAQAWGKRYPEAFVVVTGDFNTANSHRPHRILLDGGFADAWDSCQGLGRKCLSHTFASTFHGWLGSVVNTYGARILQFVIQTVHGCGVDFPKSMPGTVREAARMVKHIAMQLNARKLLQNMPSSLSRLHVDWILFQQPLKGPLWQQKGVIVAEVRDTDFSSDHFPVLALFKRPHTISALE